MTTKEGGKQEDMKFVSLRMKKPLVDKLEDMAWESRTDRTTQITRACEFYVNAIKCPKCETLNDSRSNYCSVCSTPLSNLAKERTEEEKKYGRFEEMLLTIVRDDDCYQQALDSVIQVCGRRRRNQE